MVSLVVLSQTPVVLTLDSLRRHLDAIYPGHFLPPRETGTFVVDGPVPGAQFLIWSSVPEASGAFILNSVGRPYTGFSDFAEHIAEPGLRGLARAQRHWLSLDRIGDASPTEAYRFIGSVLARLAPSDAAALVHPSRMSTLRVNPDVRHRLASGAEMFGGG